MDELGREEKRLDRADQIGLAAGKTPVTLSAGGLLALLTFLGNASAQTIVSIAFKNVRASILLFLLSIVAILLAMLFSYRFYASQPGTNTGEVLNRWIIMINSSLAVLALGAFVLATLSIALGVVEK